MKQTACDVLEKICFFVVAMVLTTVTARPQPRETGGEVSETDSQETTEQKLDELERQIQVLAEELEKLKLGDVAEEKSPTGQYGFAPSASKVYGIEKGVSIGGYGEVVFQDFATQRDDGSDSGQLNQFDFLRAIVYFGYKWNDRILFNSELEFEHASTGKKGEASVEFAYLDFFLRPEVNLRGGLLLIPVGFVNELHEPPVFHGATRPQVERVIIPTTWRENGAGAFGDIGPFSYRTYVVAGLTSAGFSSSSALRGGRQKGSKSLAEDLAWTGRFDLTEVPGLLLGVSFFIGGSGQGQQTTTGDIIGGQVNLVDAHVQYNYRGWQFRGLFTRATIGDAAEINRSRELTGSDSIGSEFGGGYIEAAFDIMSLRAGGSSWALTPFARYEKYDTQAEVPTGFERNPANDRSLWTVGFDLKPHPSVVIKLDYQNFKNQANTGVNQWNIALGYMF
jgi:hypothetical protein